jgi:hypothetical protein
MINARSAGWSWRVAKEGDAYAMYHDSFVYKPYIITRDDEGVWWMSGGEHPDPMPFDSIEDATVAAQMIEVRGIGYDDFIDAYGFPPGGPLD